MFVLPAARLLPAKEVFGIFFLWVLNISSVSHAGSVLSS